MKEVSADKHYGIEIISDPMRELRIAKSQLDYHQKMVSYHKGEVKALEDRITELSYLCTTEFHEMKKAHEPTREQRLKAKIKMKRLSVEARRDKMAKDLGIEI